MTITIYVLIGIASVLAVEGAIYFAFPRPMQRLVSAVTEMRVPKLRQAGFVAFVAGVVMFLLLTRFGPL